MLEQLGSDELLLDVKRPGEAIVRVRWTPYWFATRRLRRALRELDPRDRAEGGIRPHEHPLLARAAVLSAAAAATTARCAAGPPVRGACTRLGGHAPVPPAAGAAGQGLASERSLAPERLARRPPPAGPLRRRLLRVPARARLRGRPGRPGVRERAQPRARRAHARASSSSRASRPGRASQDWILTGANWMYVNSHFVVTTTFLIWLYLARNQRLLLRAQHVHGRHGARARRLPGLPDRAAALPARVGLHRHGRRRSSASRPSTAPTCSTTRSPRCRACTWRSR